ncbi:hypothetical protein VKT23_019903 [Stygiomarasmius scandens]|uniref:Uncharacterized protein n=1 Tax=Marasmiellus scandens TaxID=2682957 RepID=A0ABR1IK88_9AGAR
MVYRNPFLNLQAYGSDEDEQTPNIFNNGNSIAGSDDEGDGGWEAGDNVGVGGWEDEDALAEDSDKLTGTAFLDDLERHYDPRNFHSKSPILIQSSGDILDKPMLHRDLINKAILMSEQQQLFWKIKCNPGLETQVVFDVMNNFFSSDHLTAQRYIDLFALKPDADVDELIRVLQSVLAVESLPESVRLMVDQVVAWKSELVHQLPRSESNAQKSLPEQAFEYLLSFVQCDSTTIPEAEVELLRILQLDTLPQPWLTAMGKSVVEPGTSADAALKALQDMKDELVPANLQSTAPTPSSAPPNKVYDATMSLTPDPGAYRLFSAFTVPDVTGAVYLEACLGKNPQNTPIIEFLHQHPAVLKVGNVCLDQTSNLNHQKVWLQSIPVSEIRDLFNLSPSSISPFTWVKVTRGQYKDDIGLVVRREISTAQRRLAVLLVPRLDKTPRLPPLPPPHPNHPLVCAENMTVHPDNHKAAPKPILGKHKQEQVLRVAQYLFDRNNWLEGKAEREWVEVDLNMYRMDGHHFQYDLLLMYLPYSSVTDVDVQMDSISR